MKIFFFSSHLVVRYSKKDLYQKYFNSLSWLLHLKWFFQIVDSSKNVQLLKRKRIFFNNLIYWLKVLSDLTIQVELLKESIILMWMSSKENIGIILIKRNLLILRRRYLFHLSLKILRIAIKYQKFFNALFKLNYLEFGGI